MHRADGRPPVWGGVGKCIVLGLMWWSWVGYAWLTSVVNPEEGSVRFAIFAAMAAMLGGRPVRARGVRRLPHAVRRRLRRRPLRPDRPVHPREPRRARAARLGHGPGRRHLVGCGLLVVGALFEDPNLQAAIWAVALALDMLEPFLFGSEGWKLHPGHFAERHELIIIIALGESIVAIGVGAGHHVDAGVVAAAVLDRGRRRALVALLRHRRPRRRAAAQQRRRRPRAERHRPRLVLYLHFPMVAGIVLLALGMKKTLGHVDDPLKTVPAAAMLGGTAVYLLAHVAFRWRNVHRLSTQRLVAAAPVRPDPARHRNRRAADARPARGPALRPDRLRDRAVRRPARPAAPPARSGLERVGKFVSRS